jgi:hypothetical protein
MKGESLYEVWREEMRRQNVDCSTWEEIGPYQQKAWTELAKFMADLIVRGVRP